MDLDPGSEADSAPQRTRGWKRAVKPVLTVVKYGIIAFVVYYVIRLIKGIDWSEVGYAVTHLEIWQALVLLIAVTLRQVILAFPLGLLVENLTFRRALRNEFAATVVATAAPNPSDVILRLAMFKSWGIDIAGASAGLTLNTLIFYVARLCAPVIGFVGLWLWWEYDAVVGWTAATSGLAGLAMGIGLIYALKAATTADRVGRLIGRLATKVRPAAGGEDEWARRVVTFQSLSAHRIRTQRVGVGLGMLGLLLIEAAIAVLAFGFCGVPMDGRMVLLIALSFWIVYPLTALPMMGLGVLDASLVALVAQYSSVEAADLLAGVIVWRITVQLLPNVVGLVTLLWWKRWPGSHVSTVSTESVESTKSTGSAEPA